MIAILFLLALLAIAIFAASQGAGDPQGTIQVPARVALDRDSHPVAGRLADLFDHPQAGLQVYPGGCPPGPPALGPRPPRPRVPRP